MASDQLRCWMMTRNNPDEALTPEDVAQWPQIRAGVWQLEIGENGTVHYQGYFEFMRGMRMANLKAIDPVANWQARGGSQAEAIAYCMKPDPWDGKQFPDDTRLEGPFRYGQWAQAGKRLDFNSAIDLVVAGASNEVLARDAPGAFVRYHRGFEALRLHLPQPAWDPATKVTDCIMYWGPPRTGKSWRLRMECPSGPDWFWAAEGKWFDGYAGQAGIVFDEIRDSWYPWETLLRIIDGYPIRREIKGGTVNVRATRFRMSSNVHPKFWYSGMKTTPNHPWRDSPLRGRFSVIEYMGDRVAQAPYAAVRDDHEPPDEPQYIQAGDGVNWAARAQDELMAPRPLPAWNAQGDPGPQ